MELLLDEMDMIQIVTLLANCMPTARQMFTYSVSLTKLQILTFITYYLTLENILNNFNSNDRMKYYYRKC